MDRLKTNNDHKQDRYSRTREAQRLRKNRDRITLGISTVALPAVALGISVLNSDKVESPRPIQEHSVSVEQQPESPAPVDTAEPGSIRTVNFEQQLDGSFTAVSGIEDSGSDSEA